MAISVNTEVFVWLGFAVEVGETVCAVNDDVVVTSEQVLDGL